MLNRLWLLIPCCLGLWCGLTTPAYRDALLPSVGTYKGNKVHFSGVMPDWGDEMTNFRLVTWSEPVNGVSTISRLITVYKAKTYGDKTIVLIPEVVYYENEVPVAISRGTVGEIDYLGNITITKGHHTWMKSTTIGAAFLKGVKGDND